LYTDLFRNFENSIAVVLVERYRFGISEMLLSRWNLSGNIMKLRDDLLDSEPKLVQIAADVGPMVRARRKDQELRIDDAAALSGVSMDLLSRLENGKGSVRLDKLLTVLDGMGLAMVIGAKNHPKMQLLSRSPSAERV
jgi:hypothetical protein